MVTPDEGWSNKGNCRYDLEKAPSASEVPTAKIGSLKVTVVDRRVAAQRAITQCPVEIWIVLEMYGLKGRWPGEDGWDE